MKNAVIVHGKPSKLGYLNPDTPSPSNEAWLPWLQQQLQYLEIETQTPEMLNAWQPDYAVWSSIFERQLLTDQTVLVGHSCGAGFLVQWLSEHSDVHVGHVFLVAPSFGDRYTPDAPYDVELLNGFFDFTIDPQLTERAQSITLFYSDNDSVRVDTAVTMIQEQLPGVTSREFPGYGHFRGKRDMASDAFPELLETIKNHLAVG
jgi:predicted alpha/beta hydrolase family esterase